MIKNKKERKTMKIDKDKLIDHIINWLNGNIDKSNFDDYPEFQEMLAQDSADLKEKIDLYLEGVDEF
jgi:hypothetical protein